MTNPSHWGLTSMVALVATVGSALVGAWFTGQAVAAGDLTAMIVRFVAAAVLGSYYLVLFRTARHQTRRPDGDR